MAKIRRGKTTTWTAYVSDGDALASVLSNLDSRHETMVDEYLAAITPVVTGVNARTMGTKLILDFRQELRGARHPGRFRASNMSDGTLRVLGVLVALFQSTGETTGRRHLEGVDEPESALYPAAAGVPIDSLTGASQLTRSWLPATARICSTTSPYQTAQSSRFCPNTPKPGSFPSTRLDVPRSAILFTAGELLRMDQLRPDPEQSTSRHPDLFANASTGRRPVWERNSADSKCPDPTQRTKR